MRLVAAICILTLLGLIGLAAPGTFSRKLLQPEEVRFHKTITLEQPREGLFHIASLIARAPHPALPSVVSITESGVELALPTDLVQIEMLTDEIRVAIIGVLKHLKSLSLVLRASDKSDLVHQFMIDDEGQVYLSSISRLVQGKPQHADDSISLLIPPPALKKRPRVHI
jgi:hypothetical protein